ncbi:MAG: hypothetical protein IK084_06075, partial [Bacteroidaceae bacterium]|nr:hypothetical protein [Bacteroidaceae bacterium]
NEIEVTAGAGGKVCISKSSTTPAAGNYGTSKTQAREQNTATSKPSDQTIHLWAQPDGSRNYTVTWACDNPNLVLNTSTGTHITATWKAVQGNSTPPSTVIHVTANFITPETKYLYNPYTDKFLSKGLPWGQSAVVDDYGIPFELIPDGDYTRLHALENVSGMQHDESDTGDPESKTHEWKPYLGGAWWMWTDWDDTPYMEDEGKAEGDYKYPPAEKGYYKFIPEGNCFKIQHKYWETNDPRHFVYIVLREGGEKYRIAGNSADGDNVTNVGQILWQWKTQHERDSIIIARKSAKNVAAAVAAGLTVANESELAGVLANYRSGNMTMDGMSFYEDGDTNGKPNNWTYTNHRGDREKPTIFDGTTCISINGTGDYRTPQTFAQNLTGMPEGLYKVTAKGFYCEGTLEDLYNWHHDNGLDSLSTAYVKANGYQAQLPAWSEHATFDGSAYYPEPDPLSHADPKNCFNADNYVTEFYTYVGGDGKLDISIGNNTVVWSDGWIVLGDVTLTYYMTSSDYYLYNPTTQKYLGTHGDTQANNSTGTKAYMDPVGVRLAFPSSDAIDTHIFSDAAKAYSGEDGHFLYLDGSTLKLNGGNSNKWDLERSGTTFYLKQRGGTQYLASNGNALGMVNSKTEAARWEVKSYHQRVQELEDKTPLQTTPVDATFLIRGNDLTRGEPEVYSAWITKKNNASTTLGVYDGSLIVGDPSLRRGGAAGNFVAEATNCNFDFSQTISDIPYGVYTLTVQGIDINGTTSKVYIGDIATGKEKDNNFKTGSSSDFENGALSNAFTTARAGTSYDTSVGINITGNSLKVGVRNTAANVSQRSAWDNFRLTYRPFNTSDLAAIGEEALAVADNIKNKTTNPDEAFKIDMNEEPHVKSILSAATLATTVRGEKDLRDNIVML